MKKNLISLLVLSGIVTLSMVKGFAQQNGKELQYQMTNSKDNSPVIVKDTLKGQQPIAKHKVECAKDGTAQSNTDVENNTLSDTEKNKLIIDKKK